MKRKLAPPAPARGVIRSGRITVEFELSSLGRDAARAFAALATRGVREFEQYAGLRSRTRLRFVVCGGTHISTARARTILLPAYRVASRSAPYLHEIAHVLLPCRHAPPWFSEGLACYLESAVSERGGGYDSHLFSSDGNRGLDAHAARWLADPRGQRVLPFIGTRGLPPGIVADRHNVAAPFYVLSHSLVKYLADQVGIAALIRLARAQRFAAELRRVTEKSAAAWRSAWLGYFVPPASSRRARH